ncbi:MAG: TraR/DksA C4-type zinc finger protein [Candidatus Cloacimonadales bacterium]|jgi:RNA polymerase-binding transcription factor DksA|nr:TraR/DksA C4-type zinc finger protein [Candidatus Cloacimonadota bacterium]MDD2651079.1 TraR/DksA C4-type zinc finger protein [Candidatus Cloacimonadota bacterium]MDX9977845.1 TraR/DksA C4-type zinc finger protein [Candidatus Cloacimonadales bacterium]
MAVERLPDDVLKQYEDVLLKEREDSLMLISSMNESQKKGSKNSSGDSSSYAFHQADQGTDTAELEKQAHLIDIESKKLKSINEALKRVHNKTYGICEICGEYIQNARLKIIPYARFCVGCKSKEEKRKKK